MKNFVNLRKIKLIALMFLFSSVLYAQSEQNKKAKIEKYEDSMFWEITGTDKNGNESKIYVLGTIHYGDDRLYPIPNYILLAFNSADTVCWELSFDDFANVLPETQKRMMQEREENLKENRIIYNYLSENEIKFLEKKIGKSNLVNYMSYNPWVLTSALDSKCTENTNLKSDKSYDMFFFKYCNILNTEIRALDTLQIQMDVIAYGDYDYQIDKLKQSIKEYKKIKHPENELQKLYELYLTHDEKKVADYYTKVLENESEEYLNALIYKRNKSWVEQFKQMLDEGGITFVFAGTAHFIGEGSVFDLLRKEEFIGESEIKKK